MSEKTPRKRKKKKKTASWHDTPYSEVSSPQQLSQRIMWLEQGDSTLQEIHDDCIKTRENYFMFSNIFLVFKDKLSRLS